MAELQLPTVFWLQWEDADEGEEDWETMEPDTAEPAAGVTGTFDMEEEEEPGQLHECIGEITENMSCCMNACTTACLHVFTCREFNIPTVLLWTSGEIRLFSM